MQIQVSFKFTVEMQEGALQATCDFMVMLVEFIDCFEDDEALCGCASWEKF